MSNMKRRRIITIGAHSSATDISATPGTLLRVQPEGVNIMPPARQPLGRQPHRDDGAQVPDIAGVKDIGKEQGLEFLATGLNGNTGGTIDAQVTNDVATLLDCIFGATSNDPSGTAPTVSSGSAGSTALTVVGTNTVASQGILIPVSTPTANEARVITAGAGTTSLTLDRKLIQAATGSGTIIRSARWRVDPTIHQHTHFFVRDEIDSDGGDTPRRDYVGCMSGVMFDFPHAQPAKIALNFKFTDVADSATENPTVTLATTGNFVVNANSRFMVGDIVWLIRDLKVEIAQSVNARAADNGINGAQGYVVVDKMPRITGKLYMGTSESFGEVGDSSSTLSFNKMQGWDKTVGQAMATYDVGIQIGQSAGACYMFRAAAAQFDKADMVTLPEGIQGIDFSLRCTGATPLDFYMF